MNNDKEMFARIKRLYPELKARYNAEYQVYQATLGKRYDGDDLYEVAKPQHGYKTDRIDAREEFLSGCDCMCWRNSLPKE